MSLLFAVVVGLQGSILGVLFGMRFGGLVFFCVLGVFFGVLGVFGVLGAFGCFLFCRYFIYIIYIYIFFFYVEILILYFFILLLYIYYSFLYFFHPKYIMSSRSEPLWVRVRELALNSIAKRLLPRSGKTKIFQLPTHLTLAFIFQLQMSSP